MDNIKCDYCGKIKEEMTFCIGASPKADWTMQEGSGKMSCPDCWETGKTEGQAAIAKHIRG